MNKDAFFTRPPITPSEIWIPAHSSALEDGDQEVPENTGASRNNGFTTWTSDKEVRRFMR